MRDKYLAILSSLGDQELMKALQVNGIQVSDPMSGVSDFAMDEEAPEKWGDIILQERPNDRPKKFLNKEKYLEIDPQAVPVKEGQYLGQANPMDVTDWAMTLGGG